MKILFDYLFRYKFMLFGTLLLVIVNQFFSLLDPQIFRIITDDYASKAGEMSQYDFLKGVAFYLFLVVVVALISRIAKNFQDYYASLMTQRVGATLYENAVQHIFSVSYSTFEDQRSGELLQKIQNARNDAQKLIQSFINVVFLSLVGLIFVFIYAYLVHWAIGLAYSIIVPTLALATSFIGKRIKAHQKGIVRETAELSGSATETVRNVELVKSLGLENQEIKRLSESNTKILGLELRKLQLVRILSFIQGSMINLMRMLLLFVMLWLLSESQITLGQFFILMIYSFFVFSPLAEFGNFITSYQEAKASMEELQKVLNIPQEEKSLDAKKPGNLLSLEFKKVFFQHPTAEVPAVQEVNFEIRAGKTLAIVGSSGAGKTTLVKLLLGLYKPKEGEIFVNNIESKNLDYDDYRSRLAYVSQETQLFAGSIRENMIFSAPHASDKDCILALEQAAATSLLEKADKGLDTKIGEGGMKLSGGERQRLAIARALLRHPELLVFDEATSSLDSLTEASITETIRSLSKIHPNLMMVMIAHRLSTVMHADNIIVMEKGNIIETGNHESLSQGKGLYAALWREQSGK